MEERVNLLQSDYESSLGADDAFIPDDAPKDTYGLTWLLFLLLGVGVLFPWNAFVDATDYFKIKYAPFPIAFVLPLVYNYPNMLFLLVVSKWGDRFNLRGRLLFGFGIEIFVFLTIILQDVFNLESKVSMAVVLSMAAMCGLCAALLIGTLFGFAAMFPPHYMTAVMSGNGVAGIIIFGIKAGTKAGFGETGKGPQNSSIAFFACAGGVILTCFVVLILMPRLTFVRYHIELNARKNTKHHSPDSINDTVFTQRETSSWTLFQRYWPQAVNVFWVFFVTLALFPALLFSIPPTWKVLEHGWLGVILVGIFQVGDFIGRTLPRFVTTVKDDGEVVVLVPQRWNWVLSSLHSVFFPLVLLLVVPVGQPIFNNNVIAFVVIGVFAISNGFAGTIPMIYGPSTVQGKDAGRVGTMMAVFLNLGIFLGSHMAFFLLWSVNPKLDIS